MQANLCNKNSSFFSQVIVGQNLLFNAYIHNELLNAIAKYLNINKHDLTEKNNALTLKCGYE